MRREGAGVQRKQTQGTCAGDGHQSYSSQAAVGSAVRCSWEQNHSRGSTSEIWHWRAEATDARHVWRNKEGAKIKVLRVLFNT